MKKLLSSLTMLITMLTLSSLQAQELQSAVQKYPVMSFEQNHFDLGTLHEGDVVERIYKFTNTGDAPLIITRIKASCGCTVPSGWSKEPIMPGQKGEFKVRFNTRNKIHKQHKTITIFCNTKNKTERVSFSANVIPDPEMEKQRAERRKRWAEQRKKRQAEMNMKKGQLNKEKRIGELRLKNKKKNHKENTLLNKKLNNVNKKQENIASDNGKIQEKIIKRQKEIAKLEKKIKKHKAEIKKLERKIAKQKRKLAKLKERL
jgi:hypothetical protein